MHTLSIVFVAALSIAIYANTLKNGFVYDDKLTIVDNTLIKSLDNRPVLFNKSAYFSLSAEISYRPVVTFSYLVDYALYDLKPWGFHLTNLFLHAVNGVLLYILLTLLLTPSSSRLASTALLISLLFVSHPVLTEAVNCVSYREDLLAFMFYIATLCIYLTIRTKPATNHRPLTTAFLYLLSCLAYLLALLSKEMAVTLPLIVLCYEWLYGEGEESLTSRLFSRYVTGYITITLFYLYLRFYLFHNPEEQTQAWSLTESFLTLPWFVISYLKLSLFPAQLSADYVIKPVASILSPSFILPFISLISILAVSFRGFTNIPSPLTGEGQGGGENVKEFSFGTLFFLISLLPVYNIIPISNPFAERYLYLPMAGLAIIAGVALNAIWHWNKRLLYISSLLILGVFAFATISRNAVWRDNYSLWKDTVRKMPDSSRAHNNLGTAYNKLGRTEDAVLEYKSALSLKPDYPEAHNNLGNAYNKFGRTEDAVLEYKSALSLKPDYPEAHNNLGYAYANVGRTEDAILEYRTALRLKPGYPDAHNNLGNVYDYLGLTEDAISEYREALRLKPDFSDCYFNLGMVYKKKGLTGNAIKAFENALRFNPNDTEARQELESLR